MLHGVSTCRWIQYQKVSKPRLNKKIIYQRCKVVNILYFTEKPSFYCVELHTPEYTLLIRLCVNYIIITLYTSYSLQHNLFIMLWLNQLNKSHQLIRVGKISHTVHKFQFNNGNWTEWSAIWSEIIHVISKSNERAERVWFEFTSMISDQNCKTRSSIATLLDPFWNRTIYM